MHSTGITCGEKVYSTFIHHDIVFLDVTNDSYSFILANDTAPHASETMHGGAFAEPNDLDASDKCQPEVPKWRDLPEAKASPIRLHDLLRFWIVLLYTSWHFIGRPLAHVIHIGSRKTMSGERHGLMVYATQFDIFDRLSVWLPERADCLFRSFFLINFLKAAGLSADWIFAVHLYPFRAHCWIAVDDHVVGDSAHRVLAFQPILTVNSSGTR